MSREFSYSVPTRKYCENMLKYSLRFFEDTRQVDPTSFLAKLYILRDELLFLWQNPSIIKTELLSNHQLVLEIAAAIIIFLVVVAILLKPSSQKTKATETTLAEENAIAATSTSNKTFSRALVEQQKKEPSLSTSNRPIRPTVKKIMPAPLHELSEDEERALKDAMVIAGKQALAEATGEPHQTEIFQSSQASEAAKKIFAGQVRGSAIHNPDEAFQGSNNTPLSPLEFVMIYFMAPRSQAFEGENLFAVLRELGLQLNDQHVFEYTNEQGLQFYVSSAVKPGHFDIHRLHYHVPGIAFVLDLMSVANPETAFNEMLSCVHAASQMLKGDILDETRQRLTQASIHQFMARIKAAKK